MSDPNKGKGIEDDDSSFGDLVPPNQMIDSAELMRFGQTFDNAFVNGDSCNQGLYLGSVVPGPDGTMNNIQGLRNGNSSTHVPASHYQVLMSDQSHSVHRSALLMPPATKSRLEACVPNGSDTLYYNPGLAASGRFSENGMMMPSASNLGTSNRAPHDLNFSSNIYHNTRNGVGFHSHGSPTANKDRLPGFPRHTMPTAAQHGIPLNKDRSLPFRTQDSSHDRRVMHNPPQGVLGNKNRTPQSRVPNPPHGSHAMHNSPLGASQPRLTVAAAAYIDAWHAEAARARNDGAQRARILQAYRGSNAIFPPQQSRAIRSVQKIGPVASSQRSSASFPSQTAGVFQLSREAGVLPASGFSHGQAHRTNNYVSSVAGYHSVAPQGQIAHSVNTSHSGQVNNTSRNIGHQISASQGEAASNSLHAGNQIDASQLQPAPAVNHVLQAQPPVVTIEDPLPHFISFGINYWSGPSGRQGGLPARLFQLPRLDKPCPRIRGQHSSPNGLAATTFHKFNDLPTEIRLMVWNCTIRRGAPRFVFFCSMILPPAMAQANVEAREVYKKDCKYYKLADRQRITIYAPKGDVFIFERYIPGLRLATPGKWSIVPVEMTPSSVPLGLLSVGRFDDTPIQSPDAASTWMSGVASFAVHIHLAFNYFRSAAKLKADCNWKKLADMCPDLQVIFLISGAGPSTTTTLDEMTHIDEKELDNRYRNPEQYWVSQIIEGHQRNLQNGNTRDFNFKYVVSHP